MVENNIDNTSYGESSAHMCFRWLRDYHKSRKKNHESNRIVDVVEENEEYDHSEDSDCDIDDYLFERSKPRIYPQGCKLELKSALSRQMTEGITSDLESDDEQVILIIQ